MTPTATTSEAIRFVRSAYEHEALRMRTTARSLVGLAALFSVLLALSLAASSGMPATAASIGGLSFLGWLLFTAVAYVIRSAARVAADDHPVVRALANEPAMLVRVEEVTVGRGRRREPAVRVVFANGASETLFAPGGDHAALLSALSAAVAAHPPPVDAAMDVARVFAPRRARRRAAAAKSVFASALLVAPFAIQYGLATLELDACDAIHREVDRRMARAKERDAAMIDASFGWPAPPSVDSLDACPPIVDAVVYERLASATIPDPDPADVRSSDFTSRGPHWMLYGGLDYFELYGRSRKRQQLTRALEAVDDPRPVVDVHQSRYREGPAGGTVQQFLVRVLDIENRRVVCVARFEIGAADDYWMDRYRRERVYERLSPRP